MKKSHRITGHYDCSRSIAEEVIGEALCALVPVQLYTNNDVARFEDVLI